MNNNLDTNTVKGSDAMINISVSEQTESSRAQNVTFNDANPAWYHIIENDLDETFGNVDNDDATLGNFLQRPVKIKDFTWSPAATFFETFNPWSEFLTNPRIINRINNFNLIRCNLHVRFLINGSPFHYGRLLVGYKPRYDPTPGRSPDRMETIAAYNSDYNCALSQKPHVFLDPTTSSGADMTLPYINTANYMSIPDSDWYQMGGIIMQSLATLKHAQGSADKVAISVFAWAEDVSLAIPTVKPSSDLVAQTGDEFEPQMGLISRVKDEYGGSFISKPAAAVAHIAGKLSRLPVIGPYAMATQAGAGTLSDVASLLGFSKPTTHQIGYQVQQRPGGNLSNTNVPDTSEKLSLDWKQETTVDPRTVGLGSNDDMALRSIVAHESYMDKFTWAQATASETLLWNTYVTPCVGVGNTNSMYLTATGTVAAPFNYWRGTIRYRFVIEASNYHRGRLKIVFDPYDFDAGSEYQTQYTHVVDLHSERDFTIDVGWGQKYTYLECEPDIERYIAQTDTSPLLMFADNFHYNGVLAVYSVNELTGPDDAINNDINISVFISMGDDAEFFGPTDDIVSTVSYFAQSGFEAQSGEEASEGTTQASKPVHQQAEMAFAPHMLNDEKAVAVYHGDPVVSFRSLLKRYNYHTSVRLSTSASSNSTVNRVEYEHWQFPFYRGDAVIDVSATPDSTNSAPGYNLAANTLLNFLTPCFVGYRGGIRWKALCIANSTIRGIQSYSREPAKNVASRDAYRLFQSTQATGTLEALAVEDAQYYKGHNTSVGATIVPIDQNPVVEAEIPFHSNKRFYHARRLLAKEVTQDECNPALYRAEFITGLNTVAKTQFYCAAADDFSLFMFQGGPLLKPYTVSAPI